MITTSSDVFHLEEKQNKWIESFFIKKRQQAIRFHVFMIFKEKLGLILAWEFQVTFFQENSEHLVQQVGQKLLFLSKRTIQQTDWNCLKNSQALPFKDKSGKTLGCQIILKQQKDEYIFVNLLDQGKTQNLFQYESKIGFTGYKKILHEDQDHNCFIIIISTRLKLKLIKEQLFNQDGGETYQVIKQLETIILHMKIPTLNYLLMNDFDRLKSICFFQSQQLLSGLSLCDISLSDPVEIQKTLKNKSYFQSSISGTLIDQLSFKDQVRRKAFKEIGFMKENLIIQQDLNLRTTINRGISQNALKSVKLLLIYIFKKLNTSQYQTFIMRDLPVIIKTSNLLIEDFFQRDYHEIIKEAKLKEKGFETCNMEVPLNSVELPVFSDQTCEYIVIQKVKSHNHFREEIIDQIIERDKNKAKETEKNIEVEHNLINFIDLQIGEKIRSVIEEKKFEVSFDDMYYSSLLITSDLQFYSKETSQKLIDYLFIFTKKFFTFIFSFYLIGFVIPFISNIFINDPQLKIYFAILSFITQTFFFIIEIIQMMDSGIYEYFQGWNIIDFSQYWMFIAHLINVFSQAIVEKNRIEGFDDSSLQILQTLKDFSPHIDFLILSLMIMKVLFFVRVFEAFGFLVQMLQLTISKLIPFFISFLVFVIYFALSFYLLEGEIDPELEEYSSFFNKFTIIWIAVYRTALGEVHNPIHTKLEEREKSVSRDTQILLLWIAWVVSTFIMIIILLNFLIAVIGQEYNSVIKFQELYSYRHKAELNLECYQFLQTFIKLPQYSYIVFSYNKDLAASRSHLQKEEQGESQMGAENKYLLKMIKKIIKVENKNTQNQVMQNREHIDIQKYDLKSFKEKQTKVFNELLEIKELMMKAADPKTPVKK